jgi:hypothetical protein
LQDSIELAERSHPEEHLEGEMIQSGCTVR